MFPWREWAGVGWGEESCCTCVHPRWDCHVDQVPLLLLPNFAFFSFSRSRKDVGQDSNLILMCCFPLQEHRRRHRQQIVEKREKKTSISSSSIYYLFCDEWVVTLIAFAFRQTNYVYTRPFETEPNVGKLLACWEHTPTIFDKFYKTNSWPVCFTRSNDRQK